MNSRQELLFVGVRWWTPALTLATSDSVLVVVLGLMITVTLPIVVAF